MTGSKTGAGTRTRTGTGTRTGMGAGTGGGTGTRIERGVEGREGKGKQSPGIVEVGGKTRERGRCQLLILRPDASARPSHSSEDESPWRGGDGQDREARRRGEDAHEIP